MASVCLDLFSGLGGFSQAFADSDDWRVVTVDIEERFDSDICADILDLRPADLLDPDVVLASPPCTAFSMAASGTHIDSDGRPVTPWGAESIALAHYTRGLCRALDPDWYAIENPMGGMRNEMGEPDYHLWQCQYGRDQAKPTDLWGRLPPSFHAEACFNGNPRCHHEKAARGTSSGVQNQGSSSVRAKIPRRLSYAILRAVENPEPVQTTLAEV